MSSLLTCAAIAPHRRRALPELVPKVTLEESHEEVPPQGRAMPMGGFDQFIDALWSNSSRGSYNNTLSSRSSCQQ